MTLNSQDKSRSKRTDLGWTLGRALRLTFLGLATTFSGVAAAQAEYPERPITLVVPLSAGGPTDIMARALAKSLEPMLKQQVIVENRGGAGGQVAYEYMARQKPDGYALVMNTVSVTVLPVTNPTFTLDAAKDFAPITMFEERGVPIVVSAKAPFKTFEEFVAYGKANPGKLNYAAGGAADELAAAWLDQVTGMNNERIRYAGAAPSVTALLAGEVDYHQTFLGNIKDHVTSGALRLIAIGGEKRSAELPDVPAVAEFYPQFHWTSYTGILAPKGTPKPIIDKLNAAIREAIETPDVQKLLKTQGTEAAPMTPEAYAERLGGDTALWKKIARDSNLTFQ
jgi:tripartite-type tricarboxylate transporter receptor subunit TctC